MCFRDFPSISVIDPIKIHLLDPTLYGFMSDCLFFIIRSSVLVRIGISGKISAFSGGLDELGVIKFNQKLFIPIKVFIFNSLFK